MVTTRQACPMPQTEWAGDLISMTDRLHLTMRRTTLAALAHVQIGCLTVLPIHFGPLARTLCAPADSKQRVHRDGGKHQLRRSGRIERVKHPDRDRQKTHRQAQPVAVLSHANELADT